MTLLDKLTEAEKGYFAGLFDGEGCVLISKSKRESGRTDKYNLVISFDICYAPILYNMKKIFRGAIQKHNLEKMKNEPCVIKSKAAGCLNPDNWKQRFVYTISGKDAWIFLKVIYPYCNEKKEQVRVAIEYYNGKRGGRGYDLSKSDIERNEYYYKKLQDLKHNKQFEEINELLLDNKQTDFSIFSEV